MRPAAEGSLPILLCVGALVLGACSADSKPEVTTPGPVSLVERWPEVRVDQPTPPPVSPPLAELRFEDGGPASVTWKAVDGVENLRIEDGRLVGRSTTATPVLLLETSTPLGADDTLWAGKITARASAGSNVALHPMPAEGPPLGMFVDRVAEWPLSSPLVAGDELATYSVELDRVFTLGLPLAETAVSKVLVRPTDVAGADFTIEAVRLVFRNEHLASIPSGPGWHGLGEVFRESLVSRTPEALCFAAELGEKPWLDLAVGAIEDPPPVFQVAIATPDGTVETVAELEIAAVDRWRPARIELDRWAGQTVEIRLSATAARPETVALWGAPTLRHAGFGDGPQAVVVFLADTLRSDHLEAWGHDRETAPTLARLASEGVRFENAVAQGTWTKVSVSSILTSLYPATNGVIDLNDRVSASETTLAEAFRAAGYATFATSSVPFSGQLTNLHQGVEVLYESGATSNDGQDFRSKTAKVWVDHYLAWLDRHRDVPTFALVHAMDPHSPFRPEAPYDTMWADPQAAERFEAHSEQLRPHIEDPLLRRFMAPSAAELAAAGVDAEDFVAIEKDWYDGSIRGMDAELARLLEGLEATGVADRSVLAFIADHGEEFLEHGRHWHGMTVYGEVANVPMVFWGQGVPRGRVVPSVVQNLDIMPTLLDLAGIEIPERAQGRSLVPLMNGEGDARPLPAFIEHRTRDFDQPDEFNSFAVVAGRWKLVWNVDPPADVAEFELFDRQVSLLDVENVAQEQPEVVAQLAEELSRWRTWAEGQQLDPATANAELSAEELERLRSLGYL
ncbi:MAG: sulfatase [Acidobacteriota bacterium]